MIDDYTIQLFYIQVDKCNHHQNRGERITVAMTEVDTIKYLIIHSCGIELIIYLL